MKRHRAQCETWKARDRGTVQMARLAETLQINHGEGVRTLRDIPGVESRRRATLKARYGAENVFCRESSIFDKVQGALDGKRPILRGQDNPFAWPETQEKIRATNLNRFGVENPNQSAEVRAKTKATNLERWGTEEVLAAPAIREQILATNQERYGGHAPACDPGVLARTCETNRERWGADWTCQNPGVRRRQVETEFGHYGTWFLASEEGKFRVKQALIDKYGVDHPAKIGGFWDRTVATFVHKYGVTHPFLLAEFLEKRRATCQARFGCDSPMQSPDVSRRAVETYRQTCQAHYGVPNAMLNPGIVRRALEAASRTGPNMLERRFAKAHPELAYTGNGAFWRFLPGLGHHKNPDFILPGSDPAKPKKGVTHVVEVFGDYWHSRMFTGRANFGSWAVSNSARWRKLCFAGALDSLLDEWRDRG